MRLHAAICIQPHLAKGRGITPQKLVPLPWDEEKRPKAPTMTAAEQRKRMEELVRRLGDKI